MMSILKRFHCFMLGILLFATITYLTSYYIYYNYNDFHKTRQIDPYSPSRFNSSTKEYNHAMHSKFDMIYNKYIQFHNRTLRLEKRGVRGRYLHVYPNSAGGIGNRFPAMVTGMVLALLMKRVLVVTWESTELTLDTMIDPGFEILKPDWLDFAVGRHNTTVKFWKSKREYDIITKENIISHFEEYDVVTLDSNDYPLIFLYGNPHHKDWLFENFGFNPYSIVGQRILYPHPSIVKIVTEFREKHFGTYNIGLQIRTEKIDWYSSSEKVIPLFASTGALLQQKYFPDDARSTKFFIATDVEYVIHKMKKLLGNEKVISVEPFRPRFSPFSEYYAMVDILLLASCDVLLISFKSSFGGVSAALEATETYMTGEHNTFGKLTLSEPCFWAMRDFFNNTDANDPNLFNPIFLSQLSCH